MPDDTLEQAALLLKDFKRSYWALPETERYILLAEIVRDFFDWGQPEEAA